MANETERSLEKSENSNLSSIRSLFGPCGMFCGFCGSYLAKINNVPRRHGIISYCDGCRPRDKMCSFLKKRCPKLLDKKVAYCYECDEFPCSNLAHIDYRYRSKFTFQYSLIDTLNVIKQKGEEAALNELKERFKCESCSGIKCIHNNLCYKCDGEILQTMKNYKND